MRYGLARKLSEQKKPVRSLNKYLHEARSEAYAMAEKAKQQGLVTQLEQQLSYYMRASTLTTDLQPAELNAIQNSVANYMQTSIAGLTSNDIDFSTLTLNANGRKKILAANVDYSQLESIFGKNTLALSTLRNVLIGAGKTKSINLKDFNRRLAQMAAAINLLDVDQQTIESLQLQLQAIQQRTGGRQSGRLAADSYLDDLKTLAKEVFVKASLAVVEGELAEAYVSVVGEQLDNALQSGTHAISSEITGGLRGKNVFINSQFMRGVNVNTVMANSSYKRSHDGITWETTNTPQGKTDVKIILDNSWINASIKNYNLQSMNPKIRSVSLVTGTNMLYLLARKTEFLNHYLNQSVNTAPSSIIQSANQTMKTMIIYLALTGGGLRREKGQLTAMNYANVFIINDKSKIGGIRVITMGDIFSKILDSPMIQNSIEVSLDAGQSWNNQFVGGYGILDPNLAKARIASVLAQVHQHTISASIPFGVMSSLIQ